MKIVGRVVDDRLRRNDYFTTNFLARDAGKAWKRRGVLTETGAVSLSKGTMLGAREIAIWSGETLEREQRMPMSVFGGLNPQSRRLTIWIGLL
jgi:hypothetical protein